MQATGIIPWSQELLVGVTSNATALLHKTARVRHANCHRKRYISHIDELEQAGMQSIKQWSPGY